MKVVIDTNVLVSGVFFGGLPAKVLEAWRDGRYDLVVACAEIVDAPDLAESVCSDPDDEKFFACAVAGRCDLIISGDRDLLDASGLHGVKVVTPRQLFDSVL